MDTGVSKAIARLGRLLSPVNDFSEVWAKLRPIATEHDLIRIGSRHGDGGYLLPNSLEDLDGVFSAGISDNVDFEFEFASKMNIPVECLDASISQLPKFHSKFSFQRKFLGAHQTGEFITLMNWMLGSFQTGSNLLLKLDIEGFEYESVLASPPEALNRFKIMVFELHNLEGLGTRLGMSLIGSFVSRITTNHTVVHAHANNVGGEWVFPSGKLPSGLEVTLIRNDAFEKTKGFARLPHELDQKCVADRPEVLATWE